MGRKIPFRRRIGLAAEVSEAFRRVSLGNRVNRDSLPLALSLDMDSLVKKRFYGIIYCLGCLPAPPGSPNRIL